MFRKTVLKKLKERGVSLPKKTLKNMVEYLFEIMSEELVQGKDVRILGFGTLRVKETKGRKIREPKSGKIIEVKQKRTVQFRASKKLVARLNTLAKKGKI